MTASITPCWKSAWRRGLDRARGWAVLLLCLLAGVLTEAGATEISALRVERSTEGLMLSAQVHFDVPMGVEEALHKGIPLFFVADAVLLRDRWYWYDKEVSAASRYLRLSYHPLTRRWRLLASSSPIGNAGLSLGQNFDSRDEAVAAVQRIAGWKIAEAGDLDPDQRYSVNLRFRLDVSQLPRPFQIGVAGQAEWNIVASRSLRLPVEIAR